jgi:hypothetical protein
MQCEKMSSDDKNQWEETIDRLFRTLVTPISLTYSVTWSFIFFYGVSMNNSSYLLETALNQLSQDFAILIASLVFWIIGNFTKGTKSMILRLIGFNLLTFFFLISARSIYVSYLNIVLGRGTEFSVNISFPLVFLVQILIFIFSLPPYARSWISGIFKSE